jgi:hypothetical protein
MEYIYPRGPEFRVQEHPFPESYLAGTPFGVAGNRLGQRSFIFMWLDALASGKSLGMLRERTLEICQLINSAKILQIKSFPI